MCFSPVMMGRFSFIWVFTMSLVARFAAAFVLCASFGLFAQAADTPPPASPPPEATPLQCALDEFPSKENGQEVCKKVPSCKTKGETISFDSTTQRFTCKKLVLCKPRQQPVYINGKNECLDIPDCEKTHQTYVFDGTKYSCR